jgi:TRAP-type C4-dicarboxylate transport system substrate-binding protein
MIQDLEHAYEALDGSIGQDLLAGVARKSNVKPLAYTFSGGFRLMPSLSAYENFKDFERTRVGISMSPVAHDTFTAVGALPRQVNVEKVRDGMMANEIDSGETTYPRFFVLGHDKVAKFINHTEHCLFLTGLIMNQKMWHELSDDDKKIFMYAAQEAAKLEREETLSVVQPVQEQAAKLGIPTITMTSAEKQKFIDATKPMYSKYETWFSPGVLSGIMKLKK